MAEKKYMDWAALVEYDTKIKSLINTKDEAVKAYADGLAVNYDASGAAATAKTEAVSAAQSYTDGQISVVNGVVAGVKTIAEQGVTDAATAQAAAEAAQGTADSAVAAAGVADGKAVAAQNAVDTLAGKVGEVPAGSTVMGIITNIQENAYDDTAIRELITANTTAIGAEEDARIAADNALSGRLDTVETFWAAVETPDETIDTLAEIVSYIESDKSGAAEMAASIQANAKAIADEAARAAKAEGDIETAYKAADKAIDDRLKLVEAELGEGEGSVAQQIATAVAAEAELRVAGDQAAEASAAGALAAAQEADRKAVAADGRVATLEDVVDTKATKEEHDVLAGRVSANESAIAGIDNHSHSNKSDLDGITAALIAQWNDAYSKAHVHANAEVLDGISAAKVQAWDSSLSDAKAYTDEKVAEFVAITVSEVDSLFA